MNPARDALDYLRRTSDLKEWVTPVSAARLYGIKLGELHKAAGCQAGVNCAGHGCRINAHKGKGSKPC